jgi:hypothetical protein
MRIAESAVKFEELAESADGKLSAPSAMGG